METLQVNRKKIENPINQTKNTTLQKQKTFRAQLKLKAEHFENNSSKKHTIFSELAYFCYRPF